MPELPDLQYIASRLAPTITGRRIASVTVKEPIVIRVLMPERSFSEALAGRTITALVRHGPFLRFALDAGQELVIHHMLAGRLQHGPAGGKRIAHFCFGLELDDGSSLQYGDDKRMGKVYAGRTSDLHAIPGWDAQGVDILSSAFTAESFEELIRGRREQVRVFLMDQSALSAIGNAYADEILFDARLHPKTPTSALSADERQRLYQSIRAVIAWGIEEVARAGRPIEEKVRDHVKVRGRKGEPCPRCGATIRRVGVRGYDSFFCPTCQPTPGTEGDAGAETDADRRRRSTYTRRGSILWK